MMLAVTPSKCKITCDISSSISPTMNTLSAEAPQTAFRLAVVGDGTMDQAVPSKWRIVPCCPTAMMLSCALPHRPERRAVVGVLMDCHETPSKCKMTPSEPATKRSSSAVPHNAQASLIPGPPSRLPPKYQLCQAPWL